MTSRASLVRSIPFWVLLVASIALTAVGAFLVIERLARIESAILSQSAEATIEVYVGQPAVTVGATVLGAGIIGLLLTLTVAALSTLRPRPAVDVIETIDWSSDEETASEPVLAPVAEPAATEPAVTEPPVAAAPAASEKPVVADTTTSDRTPVEPASDAPRIDLDAPRTDEKPADGPR